MTPAAEPGHPLVSVLGASGFLGGSIVRALVPQGVRVRAVSRRPADVYGVDGVEVVADDLREERAVAAAIRGAEAVVVAVRHDAGERTWRVADDDTEAAAVNSGVARTVARLCAAGATGSPSTVVLFAGSTTQAGPHGPLLTGAEPDHPVTAYDRQKLDGERALLSGSRGGGYRAVSLRLPTVFGPAPSPTGIDRGIVSSMTRTALAGEDLCLWADGAVERDLLDVGDAARAFVAAVGAADRLNGRHWIVGSGRSIPLRELFETIAAEVALHTGRGPVRIRVVPPPPHASGLDLQSVHLDTSRFAAATGGWSARTDWRTAVRRTVAGLADGGHDLSGPATSRNQRG